MAPIYRGVQLVNAADESERREPACHRIGLNKGAIKFFWLGGDDTMQLKAIWHGISSFWGLGQVSVAVISRKGIRQFDIAAEFFPLRTPSQPFFSVGPFTPSSGSASSENG